METKNSVPITDGLSDVRVLAVDDFEPNLDVVKWMLGKYKMKVDCVTSGQEAIDLIQRGQPVYGAVFMDHMMPGMDGIEAVKRIRALGSEYAVNIPVIALTAAASAGKEKMFIENGFQAFLTKPVDLAKLDPVVRRWLTKDGRPSPPEKTVPAPAPVNTGITVPGVDTEQGMRLFDGDAEMFTDFLRSYAEYIPAELDKLRDVSERTLRDYAVDVHTVKGASAGIGADAVAERAKRLERMAKAGDISGVLAENEGFLKDAYTLTADIRAWLENG